MNSRSLNPWLKWLRVACVACRHSILFIRIVAGGSRKHTMIFIGLLAARGSKTARRHELMVETYLWRDTKATGRRGFPSSC